MSSTNLVCWGHNQNSGANTPPGGFGIGRGYFPADDGGLYPGSVGDTVVSTTAPSGQGGPRTIEFFIYINPGITGTNWISYCFDLGGYGVPNFMNFQLNQSNIVFAFIDAGFVFRQIGINNTLPYTGINDTGWRHIVLRRETTSKPYWFGDNRWAVYMGKTGFMSDGSPQEPDTFPYGDGGTLHNGGDRRVLNLAAGSATWARGWRGANDKQANFSWGCYTFQSGGDGGNLVGGMADYRVWRTERTDQEIIDYSTTFAPANDPNLLLNLRFNDEPATIADTIDSGARSIDMSAGPGPVFHGYAPNSSYPYDAQGGGVERLFSVKNNRSLSLVSEPVLNNESVFYEDIINPASTTDEIITDLDFPVVRGLSNVTTPPGAVSLSTTNEAVLRVEVPLGTASASVLGRPIPQNNALGITRALDDDEVLDPVSTVTLSDPVLTYDIAVFGGDVDVSAGSTSGLLNKERTFTGDVDQALGLVPSIPLEAGGDVLLQGSSDPQVSIAAQLGAIFVFEDDALFPPDQNTAVHRFGSVIQNPFLLRDRGFADAIAPFSAATANLEGGGSLIFSGSAGALTAPSASFVVEKTFLDNELAPPAGASSITLTPVLGVEKLFVDDAADPPSSLAIVSDSGADGVGITRLLQGNLTSLSGPGVTVLARDLAGFVFDTIPDAHGDPSATRGTTLVGYPQFPVFGVRAFYITRVYGGLSDPGSNLPALGLEGGADVVFVAFVDPPVGQVSVSAAFVLEEKILPPSAVPPAAVSVGQADRLARTTPIGTGTVDGPFGLVTSLDLFVGATKTLEGSLLAQNIQPGLPLDRDPLNLRFPAELPASEASLSAVVFRESRALAIPAIPPATQSFVSAALDGGAEKILSAGLAPPVALVTPSAALSVDLFFQDAKAAPPASSVTVSQFPLVRTRPLAPATFATGPFDGSLVIGVLVAGAVKLFQGNTGAVGGPHLTGLPAFRTPLQATFALPGTASSASDTGQLTLEGGAVKLFTAEGDPPSAAVSITGESPVRERPFEHTTFGSLFPSLVIGVLEAGQEKGLEFSTFQGAATITDQEVPVVERTFTNVGDPVQGQAGFLEASLEGTEKGFVGETSPTSLVPDIVFTPDKVLAGDTGDSALLVGELGIGIDRFVQGAADDTAALVSGERMVSEKAFVDDAATPPASAAFLSASLDGGALKLLQGTAGSVPGVSFPDRLVRDRAFVEDSGTPPLSVSLLLAELDGGAEKLFQGNAGPASTIPGLVFEKLTSYPAASVDSPAALVPDVPVLVSREMQLPGDLPEAVAFLSASLVGGADFFFEVNTFQAQVSVGPVGLGLTREVGGDVDGPFALLSSQLGEIVPFAGAVDTTAALIPSLPLEVGGDKFLEVNTFDPLTLVSANLGGTFLLGTASASQEPSLIPPENGLSRDRFMLLPNDPPASTSFVAPLVLEGGADKLLEAIGDPPVGQVSVAILPQSFAVTKPYTGTAGDPASVTSDTAMLKERPFVPDLAEPPASTSFLSADLAGGGVKLLSNTLVGNLSQPVVTSQPMLADVFLSYHYDEELYQRGVTEYYHRTLDRFGAGDAVADLPDEMGTADTLIAAGAGGRAFASAIVQCDDVPFGAQQTHLNFQNNNDRLEGSDNFKLDSGTAAHSLVFFLAPGETVNGGGHLFDGTNRPEVYLSSFNLTVLRTPGSSLLVGPQILPGAGTYYFIAITWSAVNGTRIYSNGSLISSDPSDTASVMGTTGSLVVGNNLAGNQRLRRILSKIAWFDGVELTADDVAKIYAVGNAPTTVPLARTIPEVSADGLGGELFLEETDNTTFATVTGAIIGGGNVFLEESANSTLSTISLTPALPATLVYAGSVDSPAALVTGEPLAKERELAIPGDPPASVSLLIAELDVGADKVFESSIAGGADVNGDWIVEKPLTGTSGGSASGAGGIIIIKLLPPPDPVLPVSSTTNPFPPFLDRIRTDWTGRSDGVLTVADHNLGVTRELDGNATAEGSTNELPLGDTGSGVSVTIRGDLDITGTEGLTLLSLEEYLSLLDLWNTTLTELGVDCLTATDDGSPSSEILTCAWPIFKGQWFADHAWNGAKTTEELVTLKDSDTTTERKPVDRWSYAYVLPSDYVRALRLNGKENRPGTKAYPSTGLWEVAIVKNDLGTKTRCLITDEGTAKLEYIFLVGDNELDLLSAGVKYAMALSFAVHVATHFGKTPADIQELKLRADEAALSARRQDGQEMSSFTLVDRTLLDVRY